MNLSMLTLQLGIMLTSAPIPDSQNLFDESWTEGNLYSIQGVVNILGNFSVKVISIVGFGIVIFSILKNALSGLYVVNPNFWDKVDDLKTQAVAMAGDTINSGLQTVGGYAGQAGNVAANRLGSIFTFLLSAIPNVRALTDFDDGVPVDKKQYFMKSIPLLVAQIFIGMLIFFGYPAKIANWIGTGGTYAIQAIISNIDPVETVQKISDGITVYNLATDGSQDKFEQVVNDATVQMMSVVSTRYTDMKKQPAQETAYYIENNLLNDLDKDIIRSILGATDGYSISISTTARQSLPTVSANYKHVGDSGMQCGPYMAQATNGTVSFVYWVQGSSLPTGSQMVDANDYFVFRITATPVAISNTSSASMIVFAGINSVPQSKDGRINLNILGITVGEDETDIRGVLGKTVTVDHINSNGEIEESYAAVLQSASVTQTSRATPVLSFSAADKENVSKALSNGYLRVNLTGTWSKDIKSGAGKQSTTTLRVTEIRLRQGVTDASYALTTWTDVDNKTIEGSKTLDGDFLTRGCIDPKGSGE